MLEMIQNDFVYLYDIDPSIIHSVRYATEENAVGRKLDGYNAHKIILKKDAAIQLKKVQAFLKEQGYSLVVYDAYRPTKAVQHFVKWSQSNDDSKKSLYYPTLEKKDLFIQGYIASRSNHCKGYTVDVTIIRIDSKLTSIAASERTLRHEEKISYLNDGTIDMGTSFDCFHVASHHGSELISVEASKNREILKNAMTKFKFEAVPNEWWHYTIENTYSTEDYDFPIE